MQLTPLDAPNLPDPVRASWVRIDSNRKQRDAFELMCPILYPAYESIDRRHMTADLLTGAHAVLVLTIHDLPVACMALTRKQRIVEYTLVAVLPHMQNQGLGTHMLRTADSVARMLVDESGPFTAVVTLPVTNRVPHRLLETAGFVMAAMSVQLLYIKLITA